MSRSSHPPTLLRIAERTIREEKLIAAGQVVLVGVSGGPDSIALLHGLHCLSNRMKFRVGACGVDHGLRADAGLELQFVGEFCASLGIAFEAVKVDVGAGSNLMARARIFRHEALQGAGKRIGAAVIALGHHADDRAETFLIRLLRGSGLAGLSVMPARAGNLIRPLIRARRVDIELHLERHKLKFVTDPSNNNPRFLRARVRNELLPLLRELSPNLVEHLCELSDDLLAAELEPSEGFGRAHLKAFARAADQQSSARIALPGGRTAVFDHQSGRVVIESPNNAPSK